MSHEDPPFPTEALDDRAMEARLTAVIAIVLEDFENAQLAAFNLVANFENRVPIANIAYTRALKAELIDTQGFLKTPEETKRALAHVINKRMDAGTFI